MNRLWGRLIWVSLVVVFFGYAIIPPSESIRLGKDLRGGATLVYELTINPGEDASKVVSDTIDVLKDRVDPDGLFEISINAQGRDRIEVTMPLPSDRVKDLRAAYDNALDELRAMAISPSGLNGLLDLPDGERLDARIAQLSRDDAERRELLESVVSSYREFQRAEAEYERARSERRSTNVEPGAEGAEQSGLTREELDRLADEAADLFIAYQGLRERVLQSSPSATQVQEALSRSPRPLVLVDAITGERVERPSPRELRIARLYQDFPQATEQLDEVIEAFNIYDTQRTSLDDPSDLIRLLEASGELSYRIAPRATGEGAHPEADELRQKLRENGPRGAGTSDARWFKINKLENWLNSVQDLESVETDAAAYFSTYGPNGLVVEEFAGEYWMLLWDRPGWRLTQNDDNKGNWNVAGASQGVDQQGRPSINFRMNTLGGIALGELTEAHVGEPMAILLDDEVYTAPNLNNRISTNGQITGNFSAPERNYIIRVLSAGSLQAKLSDDPLSQSTVGPELGKDNLERGLEAGIVSIIVVGLFMLFYYFKAGVIAVISLACNAILILGALSLNQAALTLPGIAGIVLTFGMAVDANVLIYERIREELRKGNDIKPAVRIGYEKALSSIVDGNITNLIVCIVLALPGVATQEVKGFAITLGIGVVATMFSALIVSRLILALLVEVAGMKKLSMLPTKVPAIERALEPKIKWMSLRWIFVIVSACYITLGLLMVFKQGSKMLDTEFVGGTQVTLTFKADPQSGEPMLLPRKTVEDGLNELASAVGDDDDPENNFLVELRNADVLAIEPVEDETGTVVSDRYQIKTTIERDKDVLEAVQLQFQDLLDIEPPIAFAGADGGGITFPILRPSLLSNIDASPQTRLYQNSQVPEYVGGVVVMLEDLNPAPTLSSLRNKLEQVRVTDAPDTLGRSRTVVILRGDERAVSSAALVVQDPALTYTADQDVWRSQLAAVEAEVARGALSRTTTLSQVQKFSSSIAETFKGRAITAVVLSFLLITIYIWVRFGNLRYSMAAIVCLMHDVLTCIGLIALAEIVYDFPALQAVAQSIGVMPFKIDLNMVAAILTIIGYSLNDTIIIMDRIRENRGKLTYASTEVINLSINQTISRTVITSGTTLLAVLILYIDGGEGVRAFSFALLVGVLIGTYSSVAVAAPLVWSRKKDPRAQFGGSDDPTPTDPALPPPGSAGGDSDDPKTPAS